MKLVCAPKAPYEEATAAEIARTQGVSLPFARALCRRGIVTEEALEAFLNPMRQPLPNPNELFGMEQVAAKLKQAIREKRHILVYGDYDTDGICATALLVRTLCALGAVVSYYIPDRSEGYGLHESTVARLQKNGVETIVTVDNGISAHAEIAFCHTLGMEVIVTDHHRCHETLPDADALVCASLEGQNQSVRELCGAGVALLVAAALGADTESLLPIAALATVADVVPLGNTNRTIVTRGMKQLCSEAGLLALLEKAGQTDGPITEQTLAFLLAPRMNAAGRMGSAMRGVELLLCESETERAALAEELEQENTRRRSEEARILREAEEKITETDPRILVLVGEDWNAGVVGIVASRLMERYGCPTLLLTSGTDGVVGSGRSPQEIDLFQLLSRFSSYFLRFGGHAQAAGITLLREQVEPFCTEIRAYMEQAYPFGMAEPTLFYEEELSLSDCTVAFAEELERLAPFGEGNREPIYRITGRLGQCAVMGKDGQHLRATLVGDQTALKLVAFKQGEQLSAWQCMKHANVLCCFRRNVFRGETSVNAYVSVVTAAVKESLFQRAERMLSSVPTEWTEQDVEGTAKGTEVRFTTEALRRDYRTCLNLVRTNTPLWQMDEEVLVAMLIFCEMGFFAYERGRFSALPQKEKKEITESRLYRAVRME